MSLMASLVNAGLVCSKSHPLNQWKFLLSVKNIDIIVHYNLYVE